MSNKKRVFKRRIETPGILNPVMRGDRIEIRFAEYRTGHDRQTTVSLDRYALMRLEDVVQQAMKKRRDRASFEYNQLNDRIRE